MLSPAVRGKKGRHEKIIADARKNGYARMRIDGVVYNVDTEHCFEGDSDCPCIYFLTGEPTGGFDYVKPEPKKPLGFKDLFNF